MHSPLTSSTGDLWQQKTQPGEGVDRNRPPQTVESRFPSGPRRTISVDNNTQPSDLQRSDPSLQDTTTPSEPPPHTSQPLGSLINRDEIQSAIASESLDPSLARTAPSTGIKKSPQEFAEIIKRILERIEHLEQKNIRQEHTITEQEKTIELAGESHRTTTPAASEQHSSVSIESERLSSVSIEIETANTSNPETRPLDTDPLLLKSKNPEELVDSKKSIRHDETPKDITQFVNSVSQQDLQNLSDKMKATISELKDPKQEISDHEKYFMNLSEEVLGMIEKIETQRKGELTCKSFTEVVKDLGWEVPLFLSFYIGATINLAVFVGTAEEGEKLYKLMLALGASTATGPMYLCGFLSLLEKFKSREKSSNPSEQSKLGQLTSSVSSLLKSPTKLFKTTLITAIAGMSVYLDAKNARLGVTELTGSPTFGLMMGVFNGVTEALIPIVLLDQTYHCIVDPLSSLIRGSTFTKNQLTKLSKSLTPLLESHSANDINQYINKLDTEDRNTLKTIMKQIQGNENVLTTELSRLLADQPIESAASRKHNALRFLLQLFGITSTGILVAGAMSTPEKAGFYKAQEAACMKTITPLAATTTPIIKSALVSTIAASVIHGLNATINANATEATTLTTESYIQGLMQNGTTAFDPSQCNLQEYPLTENTLNHLSYFMMSLGLYPCLLNSITALKKAANILSDIRHGKIPSLKDVASVSVATLGATCYAMIILGVKGGIDYVESVEESYGFNTRILPSSAILVSMMIATIIGTLYGGSSLGTSAILDRAETRLFNREIKTVESDDD
nr:hypothetical protein [Endozoicomonas sp.]